MISISTSLTCTCVLSVYQQTHQQQHKSRTDAKNNKAQQTVLWQTPRQRVMLWRLSIFDLAARPYLHLTRICFTKRRGCRVTSVRRPFSSRRFRKVLFRFCVRCDRTARNSNVNRQVSAELWFDSGGISRLIVNILWNWKPCRCCCAKAICERKQGAEPQLIIKYIKYCLLLIKQCSMRMITACLLTFQSTFIAN